MTVLERFFEGDQTALARIISYIEDRKQDFRKLLSKLYPYTGKAIKIGFTGPPGAGKSSLVNNVAKILSERGLKVAVIAVDPTSPFTGGALLGDRVRIVDIPSDDSIFVRSMATRGSTGGLAAATNNVATALDAYGFDYILFETVGVGQIELEIIDACDSVIVVLVPESGDAVQALKAGLMEIADVFAVNKADRPGSDNFVAQLNMVLDIKREKSNWQTPVIDTIAIKNQNVDKLLEAAFEHIEFKKKNGLFEEHRREQIKKKIYNIMTYHMNHSIRDKMKREVDLEQVVSEIMNGDEDPFCAAEKLLKAFNIDLNHL